MQPKVMSKKYLLAACLVHVLGLKDIPEFDFSVRCHSYTPCLHLKPSDNTSEISHPRMLALPLDFDLETYMSKCAIVLSLELEALAVYEISKLNNKYVHVLSLLRQIEVSH